MIKPKWDSKSVGEYERSLKPKVEDDDDIQDYKKPWVGLTDAERDELADPFYEGYVFKHKSYAKAVEAKLKEKNA